MTARYSTFEEKINLQVTDEGVVAVQAFNLDVADKEFIVLDEAMQEKLI